jgi:hydrogenase maturation protease
MRTRVIALGQAAAGDDGVGVAVLDELRRREIAPDVELLHANDATDLMWLLEGPTSVVIVDAAVGARPGQVMVLDTADLARGAVQPVSSHGVGVREVVELARLLSRDRVGVSIRIVAIGIERPDRFRAELSPNVAAATMRAADCVLALAGGYTPFTST